MAHADLLAHLLDRPWAICSRRFLLVRQQIEAALAVTPDGFFELSDLIVPRAAMAVDEREVAHIDVRGALADKAPPIWEQLGQTDYRSIRREVGQAVASEARGIVLHIDSPGGSLAGLEETASAISAASNAGVPVLAAADGMACSAAYWLASSADAIHASASTEVGNIGVVMAWVDSTGFFESMGHEFHCLTNAGADLKGIFRERPTDAQLEFLQERIDSHGVDFRDHVNAARDVDPEVFRAGWYSGQDAIDLGLIDNLTTN